MADNGDSGPFPSVWSLTLFGQPSRNEQLAGLAEEAGAFAESERATLRERINAGIESTRQEGRVARRPPKLSPQQQGEARRMFT